MGADNWAICPKCQRRRAFDLDNAEMELLEAYGEVPVEDYSAMEAKLVNMRQSEPDRDLREDYEIGIDDDGVFDIRYRGGCAVCDFSFEWKLSERLL